MNVVKHYDLLINEDNDPFRDPPELQEYMDQWDGAAFIDPDAFRGQGSIHRQSSRSASTQRTFLLIHR